MSHIVRYVSAAGNDEYVDAPSLDSAVGMVERLRNEEGVSNARVYKHVPIEFKAYYRVEVLDESVGAPAAPSAAPAPAASPAPAPAPESPTPPPAPNATAPESVAPEAESAAGQPAPAEPPAGAMNVGPPPTTKVSEENVEASGEGPDGTRRTLFSRG